MQNVFPPPLFSVMLVWNAILLFPLHFWFIFFFSRFVAKIFLFFFWKSKKINPFGAVVSKKLKTNKQTNKQTNRQTNKRLRSILSATFWDKLFFLFGFTTCSCRNLDLLILKTTGCSGDRACSVAAAKLMNKLPYNRVFNHTYALRCKTSVACRSRSRRMTWADFSTQWISRAYFVMLMHLHFGRFAEDAILCSNFLCF